MASKVLPPGFRFHPTAVELVMYYLKRKVLGKKLHFEAISVVDIYACRPEELPAKSCVKSGDQKWYFFCPRERRYANGDRAKRSTPEGFWKTTGNDRIVSYNGEPVGKIKTLIFHRGKAPKGERTNWVMHEYRLTDEGLAERGVQQDTFVLCEIFQKDGLGPRNGAQYGAPFREEDWDEEIDVALPESIGTLFPLTEEPQNQCPTSVENGSSMPPITVAGSLSEAGPSDSVQQFLHRPNENVVIEDAEEVTQDDLLMHGIYAHEISKGLNENEKTEDLGNAAAQDNCEVPPDGNEIFKDLDDLELNALMASWYDSTALQNMMDDGSYVELFDLEGAPCFTEKSSDLPVVPTTEGLAVIPEELHQVGDHHGQPIGPLNNMLALVPLPKGPHLSGDHPVTTFQDVGVHWSGNEANIASSSVPHQTSLSPTLKRQRDGTSTEDIRRVKKR